MKKHTLILSLCFLGSTLLSGCATQQPRLYQWEGYQPQVYEYFKQSKSPEEQITLLEKDLQLIQSAGHTPPPGFHAHLGMLYDLTGRTDQAKSEFETEKALFPESTAYMDFLLKKKVN